MKTAIVLGALALALLFANPVTATGGAQTFRVIGNADVYVLALSSSCPGTYAQPDPASLGTIFNADCWLEKTVLGYDGETGAQTCVGTTTTGRCSTYSGLSHVDHAFACAVTGSATGIVGNALPFPANMAISDSIVVGFDTNGDNAADVSYGGRVQRYPIGVTLNRISGAIAQQDTQTLLDTPGWWLANFALNGPTPSVAGNVAHANLIIWNQGGFDVTIDCTF